MKLTEKIVLVTGAGSGIGKAIAELFAQNGAIVVLSDIHFKNIEAIEAEISQKGGKAACFAADISKEVDVSLLIDFTLRKFNRLDILINNAGVMDSFMPVTELTDELWQHVMGVNVDGPFYLSRAAIRHFLSHDGGNIVNIASIGGLHGGRAGAAYTASKHALIGLTKNIGYQYAEKGIRCNAIAPGGVETNIVYGMEFNAFGYDRCNAGFANVPRSGTSEEIAALALFLASDASTFVNGAIIVADGGWTAY